MNVPVVWDTAISSEPVASPFLAANPSAPLDKPLILNPFNTWAAENELHFKIVNVWISYKYKSKLDVIPL